MTTFSQLSDSLVLELKRPDLAAEIRTYLNQTIRELHMEPNRGGILCFKDNLKEDLLVADVDTNFAWDIPNVSVFQTIAGARYDSIIDQDGNPRWAKELHSPSRVMSSEDYWFYRSGSRVFFRGYGGNLAIISLSWYEYPPALAYYDVANRPVQYSLAGVPTYHADYDDNDITKANADLLSTNWILRRWHTLVEEGVRAKVYKRTGDLDRARTSYSMYQSLRAGFISGETVDAGGSW